MARRKPKKLRGNPHDFKGRAPDPRNTAGARQHAKQRASERFDAELTSADYARIVRLVQLQQGRFLEDQPGKRQLWLLDYQGHRLPVIYDLSAKAIVSVLPPDHRSVVAHIASQPVATGADPRLAALGAATRHLDLSATGGPRVIRIGEVAVHRPTGVEGEVLDADMETRTISIRVGETGTLRDRIHCFDGPAVGGR